MKPIKQTRINTFFDDLFTIFFSLEEKEYKNFNTTEGLINIAINDILYFEYIEKSSEFKNRIVLMHLKENKKYALKKKISLIYTELNHRNFIVPHKSFIVNLNSIKLIKGDKIIMCDETNIPVSQKRSKDIKEIYYTYLNESR